ncbi:hypothetical protein [Cryptosporidium parvum Iowa II]|uniref:Serine aminopeptidase S33 domain-containing protein n=2 Tax=Cryptosporidium parvum TaxID=5807 RepID=Q5CWR2_CRYPI|nr:hypothetical protein [Cryptosporidium parvum Iowa II]QOY41295.1 Serine aminopeptidase S33 [Cryptosporidium parvum]WKS78523.1 hypothetical protein CPCDC_6g4080 [Cryptosporidium sp. 43IA8]EAK90011.1 hypothetical protein cgd6_4080 [Cryptosporidium parvum Iowa II]WRK33015.1 Serine aminopeptidase S33 [Cryptosporidium parvum]CAD98449.1 hypothetical predicted protein, unknown function [Cryptosporidium parvum]|eukprot:QOY41295.1 hypothetical protein CPATCC_002978 [Cryptosporidium parvum]
MNQFIDEYSVSPDHYCKEKKFSSTRFQSEKSGLMQCYHYFKVEPNQTRKGTALLIHGYSCHTLSEYMNIVENKDLEYNETDISKNHCTRNKNNDNNTPFNKSQFVTTYNGSYIEYFNKKGYDVISLDLEGHGFSQGSKCNTENLDNNCFNIIQMLKIELLKHSGDKNNELKNFQVSSHSWNNEITTNYDIKYEEKGKSDKENEFFLYSSKIHKVNVKDTINNLRTKICIHCSDTGCCFKDTFGEKIIICGISMGGAIALRLAEYIGQICQEDNLDGFQDKSIVKCLRSRLVCIVLLSPMLSLESIKKKTINKIMLPLLPIASYLFPNLQIGSRINNPVCEYITSFSKCDPLYYSKRVKALMCKSLLNYTDAVRDNLNYYPIDVPLLICHCVHDILTDFEGSESTISYFNQSINQIQQFESTESNIESEFVLWPITCKKMSHILTREIGFQDLIEKILEWVSKKESLHESKCKSLRRSEKNSEPLFKSIKNKPFLRQNLNKNIQVSN